MGLFQRPKHAEATKPQDNSGVTDLQPSADSEKIAGGYDDSPVKFLTVRSLLMGVLVSMGGFIFGYDTGSYSYWESESCYKCTETTCRTDIGVPGNARLPPTIRRTSIFDRAECDSDFNWLLQVQ